MKKQSIGKKIVALLLAIAMILPNVPMSALAAVGDFSNVSTGLTGDIDTSDTISLPIQILDYEADGMLFEYAEAYADADGREVGNSKEAADFGATWSADFASQTAVGNITKSMYGDFWSNTTQILNTSNSYASFLRATWAQNSTQEPHTVYGRTGVIMPNDFNLAMNDARYLVLVYRSNVTSGKIGFFVEREKADRYDTNNRVGDLTFTSEGTTNWTYAVYDLKQGNLANTWSYYGNAKAIWTTLPMDASGEYIDIAHVALFANEAQAEKFGEYALTDGSDRGDNRGFGLLRSSRDQAGGDNFAGIIDQTTTVEQLNTYGDTTSIDFSTITTLGYTLLGTFKDQGIANVGLLQSGLSAEGYPVYKEEVVTYVANLLKHSLEIPERTSDGWKNYRYVKGTASSIYGGTDLATALRTKINGNTGSYAAASGKKLIGTWQECGNNIASYYDAAYFLLNSIFIDRSYNEPQDDYKYLVLSAGIDSETGDKIYVFDGGFTTSATPDEAAMAIDYNAESHTIQNTSAIGKTHFIYEGESTTTLNPFLPITDKNNEDGKTESIYYQDDGVICTGTTKDTYVNRNFNFALKSSGEFVYHADDELFFDFEGDDDVYLFINGELVMDIGSAHSIDGVRMELNDYVNAAKAGTLGSEERNKKLALEEGNTYSFDFYYMERHGYGSNMRIMTNIHVTDPSMITSKTAYQDEKQLDFGSIVDKDKIVEYGFALTNNGEENLFNLTFKDTDIGVSLTYDKGLEVTGSRVYDVNGGTLEASDLTAIVSHPEYEDIEVSFTDEAALKAFLTNLTSDAVIENSGGLWINSTVLIRGIGYKLSDEQIKAGVFDNTVLTTATNKTESKTLYGQASMRVFVPADPMYYQWAGHDLKVDKTKLIQDVLSAANQTDNILAGKVSNLTTSNVNKIEFTTSSGNAIIYTNVKMDGSYNLTINYSNTGSQVFYVKITYNNNNNTVIVPILVNVTDVKDKVIVLDYGVKAELTENDELLKGDTLTVPGRNTGSQLLAVSANNGSYTPNNIIFTADEDKIVSGSYGDFKLSEQTMTYTPGGLNNQIKSFMNGMDSIYVAMNVYESDHTPSVLGNVDINNEVQMYKSVSVLPATVVYYEDSFPAIHYTKDSGTKNVFVTPDRNMDLTQSVDQEQNYGSDDTYSNSANSTQSGGTITTVEIRDNKSTAYFDFKGTGFELIGRTNAYDAATLMVKIYQLDENGNKEEKALKTIPVITEFDNEANEGAEEIYQVPVIRVDNLNLGAYRVEISGIPTRDYTNKDENGNPTIKPTTLYIDGLRIYQPMGAENENYNKNENSATFAELRDLIIKGNVAVAKYDGVSTSVSTGTVTWTENLTGENYTGDAYIGNKVESVEDYLLKGPNNEVYMHGAHADEALIIYVKETGTGVHNLQVGIHGVDAGKFVGSNSIGISTEILLGIKTDDENGGYGWEHLVTAASATEQYYTIDYKKCSYTTDENGVKTYQVALKANSGMVSYTSIKYNGLDIINVGGDETELKYIDGILSNASGEAVQSSNYPNFFSLRGQMMSTRLVTPEDEEVKDPVVDDEPEKDEPEKDEPEKDEPEKDEPEKDEPEKDETKETSKDSNSPSTGDNVSRPVWFILLGAAVITMIAVKVKQRKEASK